MRRIVLLTSALVLASTMGIAALGGPAGATNNRLSHEFVIHTLGPAKKKTPNVNIKTPGPVFSPTHVKGKVVAGACTAAPFSFTISNLTSSSEQIDFTAAAGGGTFTTIPPDEGVGVCASAKIKKAKVFDLDANPSSTLTIVIK